MQKAIQRHEITQDGITDSIIDLLVEARLNGQDTYLVFCEADPDFTVELTDDSFIMRDKGVPVAYNSANIERMFKILSAPVFDYK